MGMGIPWESHGNGNWLRNWEWEWEGMGIDSMRMGGNGNVKSHSRPSLQCMQSLTESKANHRPIADTHWRNLEIAGRNYNLSAESLVILFSLNR